MASTRTFISLLLVFVLISFALLVFFLLDAQKNGLRENANESQRDHRSHDLSRVAPQEPISAQQKPNGNPAVSSERVRKAPVSDAKAKPKRKRPSASVPAQSSVSVESEVVTVSFVDRILILIITGDANHNTRARAIKESWGSELDETRLLFFSDEPDQYLNTVVISQAGKGIESGSKKWVPALQHAMEKGPSHDWLILLDDDTYLDLHNLEKLLAGYDANKMYFLGQKHPSGHLCGGGGLVLSAAAVRRMKPMVHRCSGYKDEVRFADRALSLCLGEQLELPLTDRKEFCSQRPEFYLSGQGLSDKPQGYGDAVTFHYMKPDEVRARWMDSKSVPRSA